MASLPEHVVFDLETNADRAHPSEHEIIQIGAVLVSGSAVVRDFETLVRPQRRLPAHITELTGIEYGALEGAPPLEEVLPEFFDWVGDRPMIAHNGFGYDFVVLDAAAASLGVAAPDGPRLDTLELAHLVYPRAGQGMVRGVDGKRPPPGRSLDQLAGLAGLAARNKHDALNDARIARQVMLSLLDELNSTAPARRLQRWVLGRSGHPWSAFADPQLDPAALDSVVPAVRVPDQIVPTDRFNIEEMVASFGAGGSLMTAGRTPRPQQAEMAELVALAFGESGNRKMIEAPTGTGKTLAYLVPAIEAARASGRVSIIAPHSRVLQDQILETLEELESVLAPFNKVVLKGRRNYISLKALQNELDWLAADFDDSPAGWSGALALAILCGWVAQTPSGDWADLRTAAIGDRLPALRFLRWKLRVDSGPGPVRHRLDELDFHRRALDMLRVSHVAVLNHALLAVGPDLGRNEFSLVVDEAHDLEDSVTAAVTADLTVEQLEMVCDALWDPRTRRGLLQRLAHASGAGLRDEATSRVRESVAAVRAAVDALAEPLVEYVRDRTGLTRRQAFRYGASYRIRRGEANRSGAYQPVLEQGRALRNALRGAADALDEMEVPEQPRGRYRRHALEEEKARVGREARNAAALVDAVLWANDELVLLDADEYEDELVQWINIAEVGLAAGHSGAGRFNDSARARGANDRTDEPATEDDSDQAGGRGPGPWRWALRRVPLSVAGLLGDLWERSASAVLTSATLRSGDDFSYLIGRLGLGSAESKPLPSPFTDLDQRHLVLLTDYLPAPRGQLIDRFMEVEAAEIPRLCVAAGGGALALMTARARLEYVRDHARGHLAPLGINLLAQGDGSSVALVEHMKSEPTACLLGLRSFWEGVDIPGEALRLLVIEKIPFDSLGDPVVSARMELIELHGKDPFAGYVVPRATIAFAQGAGRLIRTETDLGVTVMLDNRMRRPLPYADVMRRSLAGPPEIRPVNSPDEAYRAIAERLGLDYDAARRQRIGRIPGVETLSQAALDVGDPDAPLDDAEIERRLDVARRWLGFDEWRPGQREVMRRFMRGDDVVAVLPTGSGKSATYQIPALVSPGVTVVVSPLIALMRDQVDNLRARGVSEVAAVYAGVGQAEQQAVLSAAARGQVKLLYVSPERLWSPTFRAWLRDVDVARIAVDEAHCISLWGHSFRPEYAMIPRAIKALTGERRPVAAVTATATPDVLEDIVGLLHLTPAGGPLGGSVDRPEIRYYVESCQNRKDRDLRAVQLIEAFRRQSAIVYVPTRNDTVRLAALLRTFGHRVRPYSGAMALPERQHTEDAFRHDEIDVVVATKAFGLGIDKPDIALIVHLEMPASIEEYLQETGRLARGARDGIGPDTGTAVLLATPLDCRIHRHFVRSSAPDLAIVQRVWSELDEGMNFIDPDRLASVSHTEDGEPDESAALALHYLEQVGAVRRHQDFVLRGRVTPLEATGSRPAELRSLAPRAVERTGRVLKLAEQEGGQYRGLKWSDLLSLTPPEIEATLFELQRRDMCGFSSWRYGWVFERLAGAEPDWGRLRQLIAERRRTVDERAERARGVARGRPECRRRDMLRYLGEEDPTDRDAEACGACDACTPDLPRPWLASEIAPESVLDAVREDAVAVALILIDGVEGGQWSRRNLVRTLLGRVVGDHPRYERLRSDGCYGRLSLLDEQEVEDLLDKLIVGGHVEETAPEGRHYNTLLLTSDGRRLLQGRSPR